MTVLHSVSASANNYRYDDNGGVVLGALGGVLGGGASTYVGGVFERVAAKYLPSRIGASIDPAKPILLQNRGIANPYPAVVGDVSKNISVGIISIGVSSFDE